MANTKYVALLLLPLFVIAFYFYGFTGFLVWTLIYISLVVGISLQESGTTDAAETPSKSKKRHKDEVPMVEYSDLVVTRVAPRRKRKWEKKMSRYSKIDRKR